MQLRTSIPITHKTVRRLCLGACDALLCAGALLLALHLRFFPAPLPAKEAAAFWPLLPGMLAVQAMVFVACDLYRVAWRYVGYPDLLKVLKAATVSSLL